MSIHGTEEKTKTPKFNSRDIGTKTSSNSFSVLVSADAKVPEQLQGYGPPEDSPAGGLCHVPPRLQVCCTAAVVVLV